MASSKKRRLRLSAKRTRDGAVLLTVRSGGCRITVRGADLQDAARIIAEQTDTLREYFSGKQAGSPALKPN